MLLHQPTEREERSDDVMPGTGEGTMVHKLRVLSFQIVYCTLSQLGDVDMGEPLHSLIIPGETHPVEDEMLATFTRR